MREKKALYITIFLLALVAAIAIIGFIYGDSGDRSAELAGAPDDNDAIAARSSLPAQSGTAEERGSETRIASEGAAANGVSVPTSHKASARNDKTQSSLSELSAIYKETGAGAALAFASERGMMLAGDRVTVVLETQGGTGTAEAAVAQTGAIVEAASGNLLQVSVPIVNLAALADSASVTFLREPYKPTLSAVSEGVADIGADSWQMAGQTGAGVKVAVLDLGFSGYEQRILEGELPAGLTTMSFRSDGDITGGGENHGTACAETFYDVAPGSQFYLVNFSTDVELANAVDYLKAQGVDIISASWSFFNQFRGDGQGAIDDIVQGANSAGIFWVNAAGNSAKSHWSGGFADSDGDRWTEFSGVDEGNDLYLAGSTTADIFLTWNRWPVTDQDYDVYLFWGGNPSVPVAAGEGWQGGTQPPSEEIHYVVPPGKGGTYWVGIYSYSTTGDAGFKLYTTPYDLQYQVAAGSLGGQPTDSPYVMTAGAVQVGTTTLEDFSSRGPTVDGRIKPDIVAPDRTSTVSYGLHSFWGTSASAPHTAAAGALIRSVFPAYSPADVQAELESRATDLGAAGKDNLFGSGKLNLGVVPDTNPPSVTAVQPSGVVYTTGAEISVAYQDIGSGIDTGSVAVTLDGSQLNGCNVTASMATCTAADLAQGLHTIGGSVSDISGNSTAINGAFEVACGKPSLSLASPVPFWASYADYQAGELSVTFTFCNNGQNDASAVQLVGSIDSGGVLLITTTPFPIGDFNKGSCSETTFKYLVPPGVEKFRSAIYVTADDLCGINYSFPGVYSPS